MGTKYRKLDTNIYEKTWTNKNGKKGKTLYFKISVNKRHVNRNAYDPDNPNRAPSNLTQAKIYRDRIKEKLRTTGDSPTVPTREGMLFSEFVSDYYIPFSSTDHRTHADYLQRLKVILAFFGSKIMTSISPFDVERFKAEQMKRKKTNGEPLAGNTIRLYLACLSNVFQRAIQEGIVATNPCASVSPPELKPRKKRRLEEDEEERLLSASPPILRSFLTLILELGARPMELLRLDKDDVDWEGREIKLTSYKVNRGRRTNPQPKVRWVPLTERAYRELQSLSPPFFPYSYHHISTMWKAACKAAGIENLCPRWLRDEAASRWAEAGMNPFDIAKLLGHSDVKTSMIYVNTSQDRLRALMSASSPSNLRKIVAKKLRQA